MNEIYEGAYEYSILPLNFMYEFVDGTATKRSAVCF